MDVGFAKKGASLPGEMTAGGATEMKNVAQACALFDHK